MDNYKTIEQKLRNRTPFRGGTMYAVTELERNSSEIANPKYLVFSYSTLIATFDYNSQECELDTRYFSATTSKHQRLIAGAWGLSPLKAKKFRAVA